MVAIMSNQKKKEYLKSSTTQLFTKISIMKRTRDTSKAISNRISAFLSVSPILASSPNKEKIVT